MGSCDFVPYKPKGELSVVRETDAGSELIEVGLRDAAGFNHVSRS
jgi:hypothetical protein